ncbi:hypothetical protein [Streptomyces sp. NPDC088789]|uniref:hypothetical protein n=2 Tax=unclassified Streptomyces TaxID=2593676 RepID=UPI003822889A
MANLREQVNMVKLIHTFVRLLLDLLAPGTGKRRASVRPALDAPVRWLDAPRPDAARVRVPRSPYGLHEPLDGTGTALIRPYLIAAEREREQRQRRRTVLVLATDFGIDLDLHVIGARGAVR